MTSSDSIVSLDELRDFFFMAQRSLERHAADVKKVAETLNSLKPEDEWLEASQEACEKGVLFLQQQLESFTREKERMDEYIASVRALADAEALRELSQGGGSSGEAGSPDKKDARFVHPELHRFKLEKQARIVGKYGGSPALGGGAVLPRLAREAALKATASPAAREIQYSKVEGVDAQYLATVMRFKVAGKDDAPSGWQEEVAGKKGKEFLDKAKEPPVTPQPIPLTPVAAELSARLASRHTEVDVAQTEAAEAAARAARMTAIATPMTAELSEKLARRQAAAEAQAAAAAAQAAEAAAATATPAWSHHAAPFGQELASALQSRRTQQQAAPGDTPASASVSHPAGRRTWGASGGGGEGDGVTAELEARFARMRDAATDGGAAGGR